MGLFLIVSGDFAETGGMDRANHALASFLADRGHELHLVTHRAQQDLLAKSNVIVHRVPKPLNSYFLGEGLLDAAGRYWASRIAGRGGRVIVNGANCDWGDINWVHYVHAAYEPDVQTNLLRRSKRRLDHHVSLNRERRIIRKAKLVLANSERTKRDLIVHLRVPEERVRTVYYGIDRDRFRPLPDDDRAVVRQQYGLPPDRTLVMFVGALGDRRKGFATVFDAWKVLCRDTSWDGDIVVAGSGAELPSWIGRAQAAGLSDRIHFLGFCKEVQRVMAACDALVAPAAYEAYGLGVQEAVCTGLPAFVSSTAGVAERYPVELESLLLPAFEDADDLAARLRRWRRQMNTTGQRLRSFSDTLRAYSWNDMGLRVLEATAL